MGESERRRSSTRNREEGLAASLAFAPFVCQARFVRARRTSGKRDRVAQIYRLLKGARGVDDDELWQHALYFAKTPEERCHLSLQSARSALSLRRSGRKKSTAS